MSRRGGSLRRGRRAVRRFGDRLKPVPGGGVAAWERFASASACGLL
jgi:hypothetical protein